MRRGGEPAGGTRTCCCRLSLRENVLPHPATVHGKAASHAQANKVSSLARKQTKRDSSAEAQRTFLPAVHALVVPPQVLTPLERRRAVLGRAHVDALARLAQAAFAALALLGRLRLRLRLRRRGRRPVGGHDGEAVGRGGPGGDGGGGGRGARAGGGSGTGRRAWRRRLGAAPAEDRVRLERHRRVGDHGVDGEVAPPGVRVELGALFERVGVTGKGLARWEGGRERRGWDGGDRGDAARRRGRDGFADRALDEGGSAFRGRCGGSGVCTRSELILESGGSARRTERTRVSLTLVRKVVRCAVLHRRLRVRGHRAGPTDDHLARGLELAARVGAVCVGAVRRGRSRLGVAGRLSGAAVC